MAYKGVRRKGRHAAHAMAMCGCVPVCVCVCVCVCLCKKYHIKCLEFSLELLLSLSSSWLPLFLSVSLFFPCPGICLLQVEWETPEIAAKAAYTFAISFCLSVICICLRSLCSTKRRFNSRIPSPPPHAVGLSPYTPAALCAECFSQRDIRFVSAIQLRGRATTIKATTATSASAITSRSSSSSSHKQLCLSAGQATLRIRNIRNRLSCLVFIKSLRLNQHFALCAYAIRATIISKCQIAHCRIRFPMINISSEMSQAVHIREHMYSLCRV